MLVNQEWNCNGNASYAAFIVHTINLNGRVVSIPMPRFIPVNDIIEDYELVIVPLEDGADDFFSKQFADEEAEGEDSMGRILPDEISEIIPDIPEIPEIPGESPPEPTAGKTKTFKEKFRKMAKKIFHPFSHKKKLRETREQVLDFINNGQPDEWTKNLRVHNFNINYDSSPVKRGGMAKKQRIHMVDSEAWDIYCIDCYTHGIRCTHFRRVGFCHPY
jgi:hypothetical protein